MAKCWWRHQWTKWELYQQPMFDTASEFETFDVRQRRHCTVCGYTQDRLVAR